MLNALVVLGGVACMTAFFVSHEHLPNKFSWLGGACLGIFGNVLMLLARDEWNAFEWFSFTLLISIPPIVLILCLRNGVFRRRIEDHPVEEEPGMGLED